MKAKNIIKKVLKNGLNILAIIANLIIILQFKINENNTKYSIQDVEQEKVIQIAQEENIIDREKSNNEVTSRHTIARKRKNGEFEQEIEKQEAEEERKQKEEQAKLEEMLKAQYTKIEEITISRDMDLTIRTGISKEDFKILMSKLKYDTSKFFYDNSDLIYEICQEYQINEIFFCGLISAESGWNIASNHRRTHNYISLMTKSGLIQYGSVEEGIRAAAKALHNNYLTEGGRFYHGKTLYGVKTKFCPASSTWVELVYGRMEQIMNCR